MMVKWIAVRTANAAKPVTMVKIVAKKTALKWIAAKMVNAAKPVTMAKIAANLMMEIWLVAKMANVPKKDMLVATVARSRNCKSLNTVE
jgi:hypothetical protein